MVVATNATMSLDISKKHVMKGAGKESKVLLDLLIDPLSLINPDRSTSNLMHAHSELKDFGSILMIISWQRQFQAGK